MSAEELMLLNCGAGETLESHLDCKVIKTVYPKGNQPWIFIGRTNTEARTPILWPLDAKSWLIVKDHDAGKDWGQEEGVIEDEMVRWHHQLSGHELEQNPGDSEEQGSLACLHGVTKRWTLFINRTTNEKQQNKNYHQQTCQDDLVR